MVYLLFLLLNFANANDGVLKIVTSEFPPYQMTNNGRVVGLATEIVRAILLDTHLEGDIKVYPWARAYKMAKREPNVLIYSIVRNPERENLFKWIGKIAPYDAYFWKLSSRKDIKIANMAEALHFISGGTIDDIKANHLQKEGFVIGKNLELVTDDGLNIRKLFAGRIDIIPYDELSFSYRVSSSGYDYLKLTRLFKIEGISEEVCLAASLGTSDEVVKKLSKSLESFKKTERYRKIQEKFRQRQWKKL